MNDDDPRQVLEMLKAEHRQLDGEIEDLRQAGSVDQLEIARLKKRKLILKDEIAALNDRIVPDIIA
ncbi:MAG: YdcH family protein [Sphingomicrobium sp.]